MTDLAHLAYAVGLSAAEHPRYGEIPGQQRRSCVTYQDVNAVLGGCYFDADAANRVFEFFERYLILPETGQPFALLDWQKRHFLGPLYGWKRADGTRRFRRGSLWVPKKNGKSTLCSGLALYHLVNDGENAPGVYCAAVARDQATIIYRAAASMARSCPVIAERLKFEDSRKRLRYPKKNGLLWALSADASVQEGLNSSFTIIDEIHAHRDRQLYDTLYGAGIARRQPLMLSISTAGVYDPTSIGWEEYDYCRKVREGAVDDWTYFALAYGAENGEDWENPEVHRIANPSYGLVLTPDKFADMTGQARESTSHLNKFLRYHLNVWVNAANVWIGNDRWSAARADYHPDDLRGLRCYGGLDLSSTDDLSSLCLWFPPQPGLDKHRILSWSFLPRELLHDLAQTRNEQYVPWSQEGWITLTPGACIDTEAIERVIHDACAAYSVQSIALDNRYATDLANRLLNQYGEDFIVSHAQGFNGMNGPIVSFEELLAKGAFEHNDNPCLNWQVSNCELATNAAGYRMLVKSDRRNKVRHKIDAVVAMLMALSRSQTQTETKKPGIFTL